MEKSKVLFVDQEIFPYLPETPQSIVGRNLPEGIQLAGKEIRIFMPRFGCINERRNQLHEVIRLSGMNIVISNADHPLIIKVASIQKARMQIYFIDNDDYFSKKKYTIRNDKGEFCEENDDRIHFFTRGVVETVKKLNWSPDVIHCTGWMSALMPIYIKRANGIKDFPLFNESKVIYTLLDDEFPEEFRAGFEKKVKMPGLTPKDLKWYKEPNYTNLTKAAIDYSDGLIIGSEKINPEVEEYARKSGKPILEYQSPDNYISAYNAFYDLILGKK